MQESGGKKKRGGKKEGKQNKCFPFSGLWKKKKGSRIILMFSFIF